MKRLFALLLVVGAMTGLFGAQMAYASGAGPIVEKSVAVADHTMAGMDCAEMMAPAKPQPPDHGPQPCKGMTLDCIAAMGCVVPVLAGAAGLVATLPIASMEGYWTVTPVFVGGDRPPEQHPPTILG